MQAFHHDIPRCCIGYFRIAGELFYSFLQIGHSFFGYCIPFPIDSGSTLFRNILRPSHDASCMTAGILFKRALRDDGSNEDVQYAGRRNFEFADDTRRGCGIAIRCRRGLSEIVGGRRRGRPEMNFLRRLLLGAIAASAVTSSVPALAAPAATVAGGTSIDALVDLGFAALGQIDKGQAGVVWAGSSPVLKAQIPRDEFERRINEMLNSVPVSSDRAWLSVSRTTLASDPASRAPGGNYVNIVFVTSAAAGNSRYELLSFRQESANTWQISGYVPSVRAPSN